MSQDSLISFWRDNLLRCGVANSMSNGSKRTNILKRPLGFEVHFLGSPATPRTTRIQPRTHRKVPGGTQVSGWSPVIPKTDAIDTSTLSRKPNVRRSLIRNEEGPAVAMELDKRSRRIGPYLSFRSTGSLQGRCCNAAVSCRASENEPSAGMSAGTCRTEKAR